MALAAQIGKRMCAQPCSRALRGLRCTHSHTHVHVTTTGLWNAEFDIYRQLWTFTFDIALYSVRL